MRFHRIPHLIGGLLAVASLSAQAPQGFSYQAVARSSSGDALAAQPIGVQFILHQGAALGAVVYAETHSTTTNANGLFALTVGGGSASAGSFSSIDWSQGPYFLEVGLDVSSSGSFLSIGTQQLMSVPYALYAGHSNVPDGTEVGQILHWSGSTWVADSGLYVADKRFGIGVQQPEAPLSVRSRDQLYTKFENGDIPTGQDFAIGTGGNTGLSIDQDTVGGSTSRLFIRSSTGHVGIGTQDPPAPLSIVHRNILKTFFQSGSVPTQNDFGFTADSTGFGIGQGAPASLTSRIFIQAATGNVGVGTTEPTEKYFIHAIHNGHRVGLGLSNGAVSSNTGWAMGHLDDASVERKGSFALTELVDTTESERMVVRSGGNVGINEKTPDTFLHVSRPTSDPDARASFLPGTGLVTVGERSGNLVLDHQGIQARQLLAGTTSVVGSGLHLQRLGGDVLVHGDAVSDAEKVVVSSEGRVGVGVLLPLEKLHINGRLVVGDAVDPMAVDGTIRWNGTDFEGRAAGAWMSLGSAWEKVDNSLTPNAHKITYNPTNAMVGIGVAVPTSTLHVSREDAPPSGASSAAFVSLIDSQLNLLDDRDLIGLRVVTQGSSPGTGSSRNIGLYVSDVSGQSAASNNLAAVLNGNVVIGDLSSAPSIGTGGTNVLAIQNGAVPAPPSGGMPGSGIQLYSEAVVGNPSVFHLMNGDGTVIRLSRQEALTPADASSVGSAIDPATAALIENMRTRLNELEARLIALGLLP